MAPLATNLHRESSNLDQSAYQRDQHLQDLYVLALFSKMSKRKPTARQTEQAKTQMAQEMHKFTERLYNPVQPNCEVSHTGKSPFNGLDVVQKPNAEQRLSMIGEKGQVLWECESSDPVMGNTLFVFKAEIDGRTVKVMFDSGASGNFIPKFIADKYNVDISMVDVEFIIIKRIVWDKGDWPVKWIQRFEPPSANVSINRIFKQVDLFIKEGFNEDGSYNTEATYEKLGVNTKCKWCEFADKPEICDKGKK